MGIKEEFAAFKTQVGTRLTSIESKLNNPSTPAEVTTGMQEILAHLESIDTAIIPPGGGTDPL